MTVMSHNSAAKDQIAFAHEVGRAAWHGHIKSLLDTTQRKIVLHLSQLCNFLLTALQYLWRGPSVGAQPRVSRGRKMSGMSYMMSEGKLRDEINLKHYVISTALFMKQLPSRKFIEEIIKNNVLAFQRFRSVPDGWYWRDSPVNIDDHIREVTVHNTKDMMKVLEEQIQLPLCTSRPFWEFVRIRNAALDQPHTEDGESKSDHPGSNGGAKKGVSDAPTHNELPFSDCHICMLRTEHCIADGVSLVEVFAKTLTDIEGEPLNAKNPIVGLQRREDKPKWFNKLDEKRQKAGLSRKVMSYISKGWNWLGRYVVTGTYNMCRSVPVSVTMFTGPWDTPTASSVRIENKRGSHPFQQFKIALSKPFSLSYVKSIKSRMGVTINDVMLSCFGGAIRRYNKHFENPLYNESHGPVLCRALVPVAFTRSPETYRHAEYALSNSWTFVSMNVNTNEASPVLRVASTHQETTSLKERQQPVANLLLTRLATEANPGMAQKSALSVLNRHSWVFANVPGPTVKAYLDGIPIESISAFFANVLPQVEIFSYNGDMSMNIVASPEVISSPQLIIDFFLEELYALGEKLNVDEVSSTCETEEPEWLDSSENTSEVSSPQRPPDDKVEE